MTNQDIDFYVNKLNDTIDNNTYKNIALCGPLGSGKSSILQSFIDKNPNKNILNISLSNYDLNNNSHADKNEKEIVDFILDQIIYKANKVQKPVIRFYYQYGKCIFKHILGAYIGLCISFSIFNINVNKLFLSSSILFILSVISIWTVFTITHFFSHEYNPVYPQLNTLIRLLKGKSTKYIIFEDLDMYDHCLNIYSSLKEINSLLNDLNCNICFIYEIKDDLFEDSMLKAKFFDYIIPVVPFNGITSTYNQLSESNRDEKLGLSMAFISFISDKIYHLRLLSNIIEEYKIYKEKIQENIFDEYLGDHLFTLITFKNKYPKEYYELIDQQRNINSLDENEFIKICQDKNYITYLSHLLMYNNSKDNIKYILSIEEGQPIENYEDIWSLEIDPIIIADYLISNSKTNLKLSELNYRLKDYCDSIGIDIKYEEEDDENEKFNYYVFESKYLDFKKQHYTLTQEEMVDNSSAIYCKWKELYSSFSNQEDFISKLCDSKVKFTFSSIMQNIIKDNKEHDLNFFEALCENNIILFSVDSSKLNQEFIDHVDSSKLNNGFIDFNCLNVENNEIHLLSKNCIKTSCYHKDDIIDEKKETFDIDILIPKGNTIDRYEFSLPKEKELTNCFNPNILSCNEEWWIYNKPDIEYNKNFYRKFYDKDGNLQQNGARLTEEKGVRLYLTIYLSNQQ